MSAYCRYELVEDKEKHELKGTFGSQQVEHIPGDWRPVTDESRPGWCKKLMLVFPCANMHNMLGTNKKEINKKMNAVCLVHLGDSGGIKKRGQGAASSQSFLYDGGLEKLIAPC
eukprot:scaffold28724_cov15-Tisochrysis_lutea.AAC.1